MTTREEKERESISAGGMAIGFVIGLLFGHSCGESDQREDTIRWLNDKHPGIAEQYQVETEPEPDPGAVEHF